MDFDKKQRFSRILRFFGNWGTPFWAKEICLSFLVYPNSSALGARSVWGSCPQSPGGWIQSELEIDWTPHPPPTPHRDPGGTPPQPPPTPHPNHTPPTPPPPRGDTHAEASFFNKTLPLFITKNPPYNGKRIQSLLWVPHPTQPHQFCVWDAWEVENDQRMTARPPTPHRSFMSQYSWARVQIEGWRLRHYSDTRGVSRLFQNTCFSKNHHAWKTLKKNCEPLDRTCFQKMQKTHFKKN